jgi:outer membrane protein assembly factor BamB
LDREGQRVLRLTPEGLEKWSTHLDGYLGLVRPHHIQADLARAYITHEDGVTALNVVTGAVAWHSPGPGDRMLLSDDLLLAADCRSAGSDGIQERWLTARSATTGVELFRVKLPLMDFDPLPVTELVGFFLVQDQDRPGGKGNALLVDRYGRVRHHFDRYIVTATRRANGCLFLTGHGVTRTADDGVVLWSLPFKNWQWIPGGNLVPLPDGDVVAFAYCGIGNSGVEVVRLNPESGQLIWEANCLPLPNVMHSEYDHKAEVLRTDGRLRVTSRGSAGTFVEELDERTGLRINRSLKQAR